MIGLTSLERLRLQGLRILLLTSWMWTIMLGIVSLTPGGGHDIWALLLSVLANALPSAMVLRRSSDMEARLAMGTLAAVQPAIGVFLLAGHPWQMDAHMFFFAALAGLALLYDWRPIVLAAGLIASHHLLLNFIMPSWVFPGGEASGRVVIHAVAVVLEASVLCYLAVRLRRMLIALDDHVAETSKLAAEADTGRAEAEAAMAARRDADARAARLRQEQDEERQDMAARRRAETMGLVQEFRRSVAGIVGAVGAATHELDESARLLNELAGRASLGTVETVAVAEQSSENAAMLARRIDQLSESISAIAAAAQQQATLGSEAQRVSSAGHRAVRELEGRTASISGFADSITVIAALVLAWCVLSRRLGRWDLTAPMVFLAAGALLAAGADAAGITAAGIAVSPARRSPVPVPVLVPARASRSWPWCAGPIVIGMSMSATACLPTSTSSPPSRSAVPIPTAPASSDSTNGRTSIARWATSSARWRGCWRRV